MKKSFTYSLLKKIILRVSLVSIVMLIISGLFITFGFIDDIKDDFGVFGSDVLIDIFLSEAFEHVYLIFILSFVILIIFIYFTVKNSLKDINQIADKVKKIDIIDGKKIMFIFIYILCIFLDTQKVFHRDTLLKLGQ